jgi:cbb3-type cytochrome oxidase subunit 1
MELLRLTKEQSEEIRLLLEAGFSDELLRNFITSMNRNNPDKDDSVYVSNWYLSGCMFSVITQWVKEGMKIPEETIAEVCNSLMLQGTQNGRYVRRCVEDE